VQIASHAHVRSHLASNETHIITKTGRLRVTVNVVVVTESRRIDVPGSVGCKITIEEGVPDDKGLSVVAPVYLNFIK
jgi:hypothetical protein